MTYEEAIEISLKALKKQVREELVDGCCPYCGVELEMSKYYYCPMCGKKIECGDEE